MEASIKVAALLEAERNLRVLCSQYERLQTLDRKLAEAERAFSGAPQALAAAEAAFAAAEQALEAASDAWEQRRTEARRSAWFNWRAGQREAAAGRAQRMARKAWDDACRAKREASNWASRLNGRIACLTSERFKLLAGHRPGPTGVDIETAYVESQKIFQEALDSLTEAEIDAGVLQGLVRAWDAVAARSIIREARRKP